MELACKLIAQNKKTKAKFLNLGNCNLEQELPAELADCVWLEEIGFADHYYCYAEKKRVSRGKFEESNYISDKALTVLQALPKLSILHLSGNNIKDLSFLQSLTNLAYLDLKNNKISDIGPLKNLKNLNVISLDRNEIDNIEPLEGLKNLIKLSIDRNKLENIGPVHDLDRLRVLHINDNQICRIDAIKNLIRLLELNISNNKISEVGSLRKMRRLVKLNAERNKISSIEGLQEIKRLKILNLQFNPIADIKPLQQLVNLVDLELASDDLVDIQPLQALINLRSLHLWCDNVQQIEPLQYLHKVTNLTLLCKDLRSIGPVKKLKGLHQLSIMSEKLFDIEPVKNLTKLKDLRIFASKLTNIEAIQGLKNLTGLHVTYSNLSDIKPLRYLHKLKELALNNNKITYFDSSLLDQWPALRVLSLEGNQISNIPVKIQQSKLTCLRDLRTYFKDIQKGSIPTYEAKVILVGNGGVGKTSLVKRWFDDSFDEKEVSTHAIQLRSFLLHDLASYKHLKKVQLNVWDFGGQDIYHATHKFFMSTEALFLLLWDVQTENTPVQTETLWNGKDIEYKNHSLLYWLSYIKTLSNDSPVILIQTKRNRDQKKELSLSSEQLENFNVKNILSVDSSMPIANGFKALTESIEEIIAGQIEAGCTDLPKSWYAVREKIIEMQNKHIKSISKAEFTLLCQQESLDEGSVITLLDHFHDTGVFFYKRALFDQQIIIDQKWIIDAVYTLFDRKRNFVNVHSNGQFTGDDLAQAWERYTQEEQLLFLSFMKECDICFELYEFLKDSRLLNGRVFIAPQLLPIQKPVSVHFAFPSTKGIYFKYRHMIMQAAILQRFIVHVGFMADIKEMWKDGIILRNHEGTALIEAFPDKSEIVIRLQDISQMTLLTRILNKFNELDVEKGVHEELVSLDGTHFVKLKELQQHPVQLEKIQADAGEWLDVVDYRVFLNIDTNLNFHKQSKMEKTILQESMTKDIFICHASEDKLSIVEPLTTAILEKGFKVWYDKNEIKWGDSITGKINEGLTNSKFVVLVLSIAFLNKHWPKKEMNAALNLEISFGNKKILPLIVGNSEERAAILQQIPLQNDKRFLIWNNSTEEVIEALMEVLK